MLHLVKVNSDMEIADHRLMKRVEYFSCKRCGHKWATPLENMMDDPTCRKCKH